MSKPKTNPTPTHKPTPPQTQRRFQFNTGGRTKATCAIHDKKGEIQRPPVQPTVYFTPEVWAKMNFIIDKCSEEVAWMCLVEDLGSSKFLITEAYVPKQEVCAVETEISLDEIGRASCRERV